MKIELGPIELQHRQIKAVMTSMILATQHKPPYENKEIEAAEKAAGTILWKVR